MFVSLHSTRVDVICEGHDEDDILEFSNFLEVGDTYTNAEMLEFISPWNDDLPYTYDSFDFDYCYDYYKKVDLAF